MKSFYMNGLHNLPNNQISSTDKVYKIPTIPEHTTAIKSGFRELKPKMASSPSCRTVPQSQASEGTGIDKKAEINPPISRFLEEVNLLFVKERKDMLKWKEENKNLKFKNKYDTGMEDLSETAKRSLAKLDNEFMKAGLIEGYYEYKNQSTSQVSTAPQSSESDGEDIYLISEIKEKSTNKRKYPSESSSASPQKRRRYLQIFESSESGSRKIYGTFEIKEKTTNKRKYPSESSSASPQIKGAYFKIPQVVHNGVEKNDQIPEIKEKSTDASKSTNASSQEKKGHVQTAKLVTPFKIFRPWETVDDTSSNTSDANNAEDSSLQNSTSSASTSSVGTSELAGLALQGQPCGLPLPQEPIIDVLQDFFTETAGDVLDDPPASILYDPSPFSQFLNTPFLERDLSPAPPNSPALDEDLTNPAVTNLISIQSASSAPDCVGHTTQVSPLAVPIREVETHVDISHRLAINSSATTEEPLKNIIPAFLENAAKGFFEWKQSEGFNNWGKDKKFSDQQAEDLSAQKYFFSVKYPKIYHQDSFIPEKEFHDTVQALRDKALIQNSYY